MVKYVPDRTGRFSQRPHYEPKELDRECENIIAGFLKERHGAAKYPVSTDDLTVLIERDTESLDQFADLSSYGCNVEGLTHFQSGRKPRVRISASLSGDENRQNRLRTTLAHEYGHVRFHAYLWDLEPPGADLLKSNPNASMQICYRDNILDAAQTDWMEWQAGYVCGALLMPASKVRELAGAYLESWSFRRGRPARFARPRPDRVGKDRLRGLRRRRTHPAPQARNPWRCQRRSFALRHRSAGLLKSVTRRCCIPFAPVLRY